MMRAFSTKIDIQPSCDGSTHSAECHIIYGESNAMKGDILHSIIPRSYDTLTELNLLHGKANSELLTARGMNPS